MQEVRVSSEFSAIIAKSTLELEPFLNELQKLASSAIEPNVFYEPCMLVPAMRWLAGTSDIRLVLLFRGGDDRCSRELCGFFPLEVLPRYNHFPVRTARLWRHQFCYFCAPLLRKGFERETLNAFWAWSASNRNHWRLVEFDRSPGVGLWHNLLVDSTASDQRTSLVDVRCTRPILLRAASADTYLRTAISTRHRKDLDKKEKKLRQLGTVKYDEPASSTQAEEWIDEFITIEARGWRGREGLAIASNDMHRSFFREAMNALWRAGRLDVIGLRVNSDLIAVKINLRNGEGSFAFMITFDERHSAFSPGLLLEIENIKRVHNDSLVRLMDSCADQHSAMFTRIWSEKCVVETLLVSNDSWIGDAWIGMIPLGHYLKKVLLKLALGGVDKVETANADRAANEVRDNSDLSKGAEAAASLISSEVAHG